MNPNDKVKSESGVRFVVVDTQATTPNHMRRNSIVNPRYWVRDTVSGQIVDEFTHKKLADLTARQMNKQNL